MKDLIEKGVGLHIIIITLCIRIMILAPTPLNLICNTMLATVSLVAICLAGAMKCVGKTKEEPKCEE